MKPLSLEVVASEGMPPALLQQVCALCTEAYAEEFAPILAAVGPGVHVLAWNEGVLVAHAMWVTRWLQPAGGPALRTAYVEAVATRPSYQRQGFARAVLTHLAAALRGYELAALSPSDAGFYAPLGWEPWRGPLFIRKGEALEATPDEEILILRLPATPPALDLSQPLSAEWREGEVW